MTDFNPAKFEEKYVHYFEELESAYSQAYQELHGEYDSTILKAIDRQILSESEPIYEGEGQFRIELPPDPYDRIDAGIDADAFEHVLEIFLDQIETELRREFGFES